MKQKINRMFLLVVGFLSLFLYGCARIDAVATNALSSGMDAVAVVDDQILIGRLRLFPDRTGDLVLQKEKPEENGSTLQCMGRLWFAASRQGTLDLRCNNGLSSALTFVMVGDISGYAMGSGTTGDLSVAFGLNNDVAISYLRVTPPKRLLLNSVTGAIEIQ